MCWTHRNALYISISVVFADYDKIENFMKIYAQMDPKSHPKIAVWAYDFWGFWPCFEECDFLWFLRCAKIDQKWQKFDTWADFGRVVPKMAEGRRHEAEPREPVLGGFTSFGTSFKEHLTRLAPPSKDGVGGFKGFASCRRPPKIKINKTCKKCKM